MSAAILIVDGDRHSLERARPALEDAGYRVRTASSAEEALLVVAAELPDAIILDLVLPGQSGFALLRRLRFEERTRSLPVLLLTARGLVDERVLGLEAGADDYVVKPF